MWEGTTKKRHEVNVHALLKSLPLTLRRAVTGLPGRGGQACCCDRQNKNLEGLGRFNVAWIIRGSYTVRWTSWNCKKGIGTEHGCNALPVTLCKNICNIEYKTLKLETHFNILVTLHYDKFQTLLSTCAKIRSNTLLSCGVVTHFTTFLSRSAKVYVNTMPLRCVEIIHVHFSALFSAHTTHFSANTIHFSGKHNTFLCKMLCSAKKEILPCALCRVWWRAFFQQSLTWASPACLQPTRHKHHHNHNLVRVSTGMVTRVFF